MVIHFLSVDKKYPASLINVEKTLSLNGLRKRYDLVVFNTDGSIHILVECKSPNITISQAVFDQIARYNLKMQAEYLMVTNGLDHFYCKMNYEQEKYSFLRQIPDFSR
jgi:hypothetical protein